MEWSEFFIHHDNIWQTLVATGCNQPLYCIGPTSPALHPSQLRIVHVKPKFLFTSLGSNLELTPWKCLSTNTILCVGPHEVGIFYIHRSFHNTYVVWNLKWKYKFQKRLEFSMFLPGFTILSIICNKHRKCWMLVILFHWWCSDTKIFCGCLALLAVWNWNCSSELKYS